MKRSWQSRILLSIAVLALAATAAVFAQDKAASAPDQTGASGGANTVTVTGCLTGTNGRYTLGTMSDKLYLLRGDSAQLKKFNARRVRVTGSVTEPAPHTSRHDVLSQQPPTLTIDTIKKVADTCS